MVASQVLYRVRRSIEAAVHGGDFCAASEREGLDWLDGAWNQHFVIKRGPRVGPRQSGGADRGPRVARAIGRGEDGLN
eukprot:7916748-Pyramimonas_sp.AAC.1